MNIAMETRLSVEMERQSTNAVLEQVSSSLQSIVEKYQELNGLYVNECAKRRKVATFVFFCYR